MKNLINKLKSLGLPSKDWERGALNIAGARPGEKGEKKMNENEITREAEPSEQPAAGMTETVENPGITAEPDVSEAQNEGLDFYRAHFNRLEREAAALGEKYPGLSLRAELENSEFLRLVSPKVGLGVEAAYRVCHFDELLNAAARQSAEAVSNSIRSGRPSENGLSGTAPAEVHAGYSSMTRAQQNELKRRIAMAAARGEKIYPARN